MARTKTKQKHRRRTVDEQIADLEAKITELNSRKKLSQAFSPEAVRSERERLELPATAYAELVGVSHLTIYGWEQGRSNPRSKQLEKWLAVRGISKDAAWRKVGIEPGFSAEEIFAERERLELSAADYAELVGVSALTIYNWEHGRTRPQAAQQKKLEQVKGISKREAWERVGVESDFSAEGVYAERERLELSAADYAELVGVSGLTIYNWEHGKTKPQAAQLKKLAKVKGIGKRAAWKKLGYL